jgi:hypothetical protein
MATLGQNKRREGDAEVDPVDHRQAAIRSRSTSSPLSDIGPKIDVGSEVYILFNGSWEAVVFMASVASGMNFFLKTLILHVS